MVTTSFIAVPGALCARGFRVHDASCGATAGADHQLIAYECPDCGHLTGFRDLHRRFRGGARCAAWQGRRRAFGLDRGVSRRLGRKSTRAGASATSRPNATSISGSTAFMFRPGWKTMRSACWSLLAPHRGGPRTACWQCREQPICRCRTYLGRAVPPVAPSSRRAFGKSD
jgi:predicted RNA-binding Zn-ribbon protein involved in translation (DUF1610 family)